MDGITYNPAAVGDHAHSVVSSAGTLDQIHADSQQLTQALTEYFGGHGATGFFEAQAQMLQGLQGLIETIGQHGSTIGSVLEGAMSTDQTISSLF
ncbi:WXG100 family type VII secretion target [Mycolicibacter sp. MYC123]|uniref:WXG100 family type VII secretion target n=1 Tax=[Mycobacterium] zoologicum TaxID=2872311 RepID=A0ABU5YIM8_9MYCO|nr:MULTISPECIES: WXG100 family type VII secretion target [unclassified Mycolicibacter]MEB3049902.1 WXG100 family type VII secretion target [Mycolicibacter sp. MYC123]MEB3063236.1 WXG100 family type VII secretion target [Mycolicibacter sp. MYC101]